MEYNIKRSFRKSVAIEVDINGFVLVRAPYFVSTKQIEKLLLEKRDLIKREIQKMKSLPERKKISKEEMETLRQRAKEYIIPRVQHWSEVTGFTYNGVKITSARGRFGSCSQKGNLCFSLFLMLCDEKEIDYVILHELCHTREMNHSKNFYSLVCRFMPDYKISQKKLKSLVLPQVEK